MTTAPASETLTDLLGDTRARILSSVQRGGSTAPELADELQISPPAVRRHLTALLADDLVRSEVVHDGGMGRPATSWTLTSRGKRLFADRSAELADELLDHIETTYGRGAVAEFLKSRNAAKAHAYGEILAAADGPEERAQLLAEALSADGFAARVEQVDDGRSLKLLQSHCAIEAVAAEHPEICAHEAALFRKVLGGGDARVKVTRRETIAGGARACVCNIEIPQASASHPTSGTTHTNPTKDAR